VLRIFKNSAKHWVSRKERLLSVAAHERCPECRRGKSPQGEPGLDVRREGGGAEPTSSSGVKLAGDDFPHQMVVHNWGCPRARSSR
jgi:hypothetical protein